MERVSAKVFFTVVWKGVCQSLAWFFGLFGYNRNGKFAKCVWGMFALSASVIVTLVAFAFGCAFCEHFYGKFAHYFTDDDYYYSTYISRNVRMYSDVDGESWLKNTHTGKTTLRGIQWISKPLGEKDSLVVFSDGKKRGYFNKYTGEVAIPAKYSRAWVFSDGIASVEENGIIKFIDSKDNQVFSRTFEYDPNQEGYVFHAGYCVIDEDHDGAYGLMNTKGITVMPEQYIRINVSNDMNYWVLRQYGKCGVYDKGLRPILPMMDGELIFDENGIIVTMPDNTLRKYDLKGNLIDDFYITAFSYLEYELEETYQIVEREYNYDKERTEYVTDVRHKTARARLGKYVAGNYKQGLMTVDGHAVTLPKYDDIVAIGADTYVCTVSNDLQEILNGRGEKVR